MTSTSAPRSRDYGYQPETAEQQLDWFSSGVRLAIAIGKSGLPSALRVRRALAQKLPGLWLRTATHDLIEAAAKAFSANAFWEDGWVAAREARWRCRESGDDVVLERVRVLEEGLAPGTLVDRIHVHVLREQSCMFEPEETGEGISDAIKRADALAEKLGRDASADPELLAGILPQLVANGGGRRRQFAHGLARGTQNARELWSELIRWMKARPDDANATVLGGFLSAWKEIDGESVEQVLDDAVADPDLARFLPYLQAMIGLDDSGVARLLRSASNGAATAHSFRVLAAGRLTDRICSGDLRRLLLAVERKPNGWPVAVDILAMRFSSTFDDEAERPELAEFGRELLVQLDPLSEAHQRLDHDLATLASACLGGPEAGGAAAAVCAALAAAFAQRPRRFMSIMRWLRLSSSSNR